ncbi:hypothetical protein Tco_1259765 [Tanacetum coccineum]
MEDAQSLAAKALWRKKNIPCVKPANVQALGDMQRFKQIQITRAPRSKPLGHLPQRMDFFVAHVHNLGKSLLDLYVNKMDLVVPRMVVDALYERPSKLQSNTLKNQLPQILTDSVRETLLGFNRRIRNALHDEMPNILQGSFANHQMQLIAYLEQILHSIVKVPNDILVLMETSGPYANATTKGEKEA